MPLPENRKPLLWKDIPFSERPKAHPSTERLEIDKLKERVAELEARIAKADALAEAIERRMVDLGGFDNRFGLRKAMEDYYRATKEGSA